ncbi:YncE family protein [Lichenibacterium dinghuense]|uniref:YncE family protein n=1 Tax=Lichenibacterium dinghuense TaxID=2895977 RepID=UPI001F1D87C0|nr:YncE family protein [Lichenibacterium sp. 6Y81]
MTNARVLRLAAATLVLIGIGTAARAAAPPAYAIALTVPLGAPDNRDYVTFDPPSGRVYVSHGTEVSVVDGRTGAMVGTISGLGLAAAQGVAAAPALSRGYVASGNTGEVTAFDLKTLKPLGKVFAADDADLVMLDPATRNLFVVNGHSKSVTVIDPATDKVLGTVETGGGTQGGAFDGRGKLFINVGGKGEIVRLDTAKRAIDARWPLPNCPSPRGLGYDAAGARLYASCTDGRMVVVDANDGRVVGDLPIGRVSDGGGFDPVHKRAFSSNSEGMLSVVDAADPAKPTSLGEVRTLPGARTMAVDPATGRVFLVMADTVADEAPAKPGAAPSFDFKPGTVKLIALDPR